MLYLYFNSFSFSTTLTTFNNFHIFTIPIKPFVKIPNTLYRPWNTFNQSCSSILTKSKPPCTVLNKGLNQSCLCYKDRGSLRVIAWTDNYLKKRFLLLKKKTKNEFLKNWLSRALKYYLSKMFLLSERSRLPLNVMKI